MLIVHVQVHVKPEGVEAFKAATRKNAAASLREAGIARFDVIQAEDDATRFVLVEVYRDADAPLLHKDTPHYVEWRDAVAELMASPRTSARYSNVFPGEDGWGSQSEAE